MLLQKGKPRCVCISFFSSLCAVLFSKICDPYREGSSAFRHISITTKEDFCSGMSESAWQAVHRDSKSSGLVCHIFYLNSFDSFDSPDVLNQLKWNPHDDGLPSDIIKFELHRIFQDLLHMKIISG